jgi:membrane protein required for colicin V production
LLAPAIGTHAAGNNQLPVAFFCIFVLLGAAITMAFRATIDELVGSEIGLPDRLGGSMLGVVRVGLIAVTLVLVFDRIIPAGRDPAFLAGSQLRPMFSLAAQVGLRSLPSETVAFIDQIKQRRHI